MIQQTVLLLLVTVIGHITCEGTDIAVLAPTDVNVIEEIPVGSILSTFTVNATHGPATVYASDYETQRLVTVGLVQSEPLGAQFEIRLNTILDRETQILIPLHFSVVDAYMKKVDFHVLVHVLDINDNTPIFEKAHFIFDVSRDAAIGTTVGQVRANDVDVGLNSVLVYSVQTESSSPLIRITPGGTLTLAGSLENEGPEFNMIVRVKDRGLPSRYSMATVTIRIHDEMF